MLYGGRVRAEHVGDVKRSTMRDFLDANVEAGSTLYTDDTATARGIPDLFNRLNHESVNHSVGEYVRGQAHTNGVESFWSMLKRGYQGTYHQMSAKHLQRYITEFAGRHNVRDLDTLEQIRHSARHVREGVAVENSDRVEKKRGRGRPVRQPEIIPATAEEIRDAIFRAAEKPEPTGEQPA